MVNLKRYFMFMGVLSLGLGAAHAPLYAQDTAADAAADVEAVEGDASPAPDDLAEITRRTPEQLAAVKETLEAHPYSPDHCEFTINFPDDPYIAEQCDDDGKNCYEQTSYTEMFDGLKASVKFRITCNPVSENLYDQYSGAVMAATIKAMTKGKVTEEYNSAFREEDGYKQAGLAGMGKSGNNPTIYIAQLWIGQQSVMSVEAELMGEAYLPADRLYGDILKSVRYTGVKEGHEAVKKSDKKKATKVGNE